MGVSTDAYLCFGYDLGADEENEQCDLLREYDDAKYKKLSRAEEKHGVTLVSHSSDESVARIVCDKATLRRAFRGYPAHVTSLDAPADTKARIAAFLEELRLTKPDGDPRWLLASYWG